MKKEDYCEKCSLVDEQRYNPDFRNDVDLMVVGSYPEALDCRFQKPSSPYMRVVQDAMVRRMTELKAKIKTSYRFAISCPPPFRNKTRFIKAGDAKICKQRLEKYVASETPRVILASGIHAARALGIKGTLKNIRGLIFSRQVAGHNVTVVVTYGVEVLRKNPGLYEVVTKDITKAIQLCQGALEMPETTMETPLSYDGVITSLDRLQGMADTRLSELNKSTLIAVDTETTSLEPHKPDGRVIAISLSAGPEYSVAFTLEHRDNPYTDAQKEIILEKFQALMNSKHVLTCAANAKFDYKWLHYRYGLNIPFFNFDVLLAEHILSEDKVGEYNLKALTRDYYPPLAGYEDTMSTARESDKKQRAEAYSTSKEEALGTYINQWLELDDTERISRLRGWVTGGFLAFDQIAKLGMVKHVKQRGQQIVGKSYLNSLRSALGKIPATEFGIEIPVILESTFEDVPVETMLKYAVIDAFVTWEICYQQYSLMGLDPKCIKLPVSLRQGFMNFTMPLSKKIAAMEHIGVRVDREKAQEYMDVMEGHLVQYKELLFAAAGKEFNLSSSSHDLHKILFENMGFEPIGYTATGQPSMDEKTLKALYDEHDDPFLKYLMAYRKIDKAKNTYVKNFLDLSDYDGRLHFSLHQNTTATYRLSVSNPSLQNVPFYLKEANLNLKALFIPDSDEYDFYDMDISNAEMRVLCAYSKDEKLIDAFNQGKCIHSLTAAGITNFSYEDILAKKDDKSSKEYMARQLGKKINFGTVYCVGKKTLVEQLWSEMRIKITEKQAEAYLDKFFITYPSVKAYIDDTKAFAKKHRFVFTYTGRQRRFPLIRFNGFDSFKAERQAVNSRIQSTSADIVNVNLVELANRIVPLGGRVVLTVHDSILFQLPKGTPDVKALLDEVIVANTRQCFPWLPVEWKYDAGRGPSYGECCMTI